MSYYLLENHKDIGTVNVPWYTTRNACQHGIAGPHLIVLHTAENMPDFSPPDNGAENVAKYGASTTRASWHITLDSDSVIDMLPLSYTAWHVRSYNRCSVGIEIATKANSWVGADPGWREKVYDQVADTLVRVSDETGIPLIHRPTLADAGRWGITGHNVLDPTRRTDPGQAFPFAWIVQMAVTGFRYRVPVNPDPTPVDPIAPSVPDTGTLCITAKPTTTVLEMQQWAANKSAAQRFIELAPVVYEESVNAGIDPSVTYALMAHETNYGKFVRPNGDPATVTADFHNWGGIKTAVGGGNFDPEAHQRFESDRVGIRAVAQHIGLYAGIYYPLEEIVDPRHFPSIRGKAGCYLPSDGWTWAGPTHDDNVVSKALELIGGT